MTAAGTIESRAFARQDWLDIAKGLGILLVVAGHVFVRTDWPVDPVGFIFLFHMPLFFIVSGYLQKPEPLGTVTEKKAFALIIPYAAFMVVLTAPYALADLAQLGLNGRPLEWGKYAGWIYGGPYLGGFNGVLWFLTALFGAQVLFAAICRLPRAGQIFATTACVLAGYIISALDLTLPLALHVSLYAVGLIHIGALLRASPKVMALGPVLAAAALLVVIGFALTGHPLSIDMKAANYGPPLIGLAVSVGLSLGVLAIAKALEGSLAQRALTYLGQASLIVMAVHQPVNIVAQAAGAPAPVAFVAALGVSLAAYWIIGRSKLLQLVFMGKRPRTLQPATA